MKPELRQNQSPVNIIFSESWNKTKTFSCDHQIPLLIFIFTVHQILIYTRFWCTPENLLVELELERVVKETGNGKYHYKKKKRETIFSGLLCRCHITCVLLSTYILFLFTIVTMKSSSWKVGESRPFGHCPNWSCFSLPESFPTPSSFFPLIAM